ncbi:FACT complex subunit [Blyttiomyces sp. JEL0837]|nr:FACT complex subunit [Blyttiomyces sp. JEL0837]
MMGEPKAGKTFENIYLAGRNGLQIIGKFKLAEPGIGFQESQSKKVTTMRGNEIRSAQWYRCARDFELRVEMVNGIVYRFDGFQRDSFDLLSDLLSSYYKVNLEPKELSLRGYNWGKAEFQGSMMMFNVHDKTAFEIPLTDVANTAPVGKNEVSIEFVSPSNTEGPDGSITRTRMREDALVEIHFYLPGMAMQSQIDETGGKKVLKDKDAVKEGKEGQEEGEIADEEEDVVLDDDGEAVTAAAIFCETIKSRADVSATQGDSIVTFADLLCLTPRGRFELDMGATSFRIRGKSNDYKILFKSIRNMFLLPKPDDLHYMFIMQLDPPVRQGQTRYPFLVFQFDRDEEIDATLRLEDDVLQTQYEGRLRKDYDGLIYIVVSEIFKGLTNMKVITPSGTYKSSQGQPGLKCSLKAHEAFLYPLEKHFLSFPKPTTLIPYSEVSVVTFARVNAAANTTRTFEVRIKTAGGETTYSSIPREEYEALEEFCRSKKMKVTAELGDGGGAYGDDDSEEEEEEEEGGRRKRKRVDVSAADFGDDDDEEGSEEDEDFVDKGSGSDVDLEFDSDAGSDASGSDQDESDDEDGEKAKAKKSSKPPKEKASKKKGEPPAKKSKTEKDPNAPKKALSAYIYFGNDAREQIKRENPGISMTEMMKKVGSMWAETSAEDKKKYEDMAAKDTERYKEEMKAYEKGGKSKSSSSSSSKSKSKSAGKEEQKFKSAEFISDEDDD